MNLADKAGRRTKLMRLKRQISSALLALLLGASSAATSFGAEPGTTTDAVSAHPSLLHPIIQEVSEDNVSDSGENEVLPGPSQVVYPQISLTEEEKAQYPKLSQTLDAYNAGKKSWYESQLTELAKTAQEMSENSDAGTAIYLMQKADVQIGRADSSIFSVIEHFSSYSGGAHGYYEDAGNTFDSQSGKKLSFADVVKDCDTAAAHVFEKLSLQYPDLQPLVSQADVAEDMKGTNTQGTGKVSDAGEMFTENSDQAETYFRWYVTDLGVMIVFPPYTLGSYAEGQQKIFLSLAEYPEIFNPAYTQVPDSFIIPFDPDAWEKMDVDGDGSLDQIKVSAAITEDGTYNGRTIEVDENKLEVSDLHFLSSDYYLVKAEDRVMLYCFDVMENGWVQLNVHLLSNGKPDEAPYSTDLDTDAVGSDAGNLKIRELQQGNVEVKYPLTDPDAMQLSSRMDVLSTYDAYRSYSASKGENGYPVPLDMTYTADADIHLTLKKDAVFTAATEDGSGSTDKNFAAGTSFSIYRTDGLRYVDLKSDADGTIVSLSGDFSQAPSTVMGMMADELFDGMMYAG